VLVWHPRGMTSPALSFEAFPVREVAARLHVQPKTVRKLIKDGKLRAVKISATDYRVPASSLEAYLNGEVTGETSKKPDAVKTETVQSRASQVLERLGLKRP
jgi:excisionase family DNA binding protein